MTQAESADELQRLLTEGRFGEVVCIARQGDGLLLVTKDAGGVQSHSLPLCGPIEEPTSHQTAARLWELLRAYADWLIARQALPLEDLHQSEEIVPLWTRWRGSDERP